MSSLLYNIDTKQTYPRVDQLIKEPTIRKQDLLYHNIIHISANVFLLTVRCCKEAVERSIDLQAKKLMLKCLCESAYASCKSNADEMMYDRDTKKNLDCL